MMYRFKHRMTSEVNHIYPCRAQIQFGYCHREESSKTSPTFSSLGVRYRELLFFLDSVFILFYFFNIFIGV